MAKVDEQIGNIEAMLQQILKNMGAEGPEQEDEGGEKGCPYCGCNGEHGSEGPMMHGKTVIMVAKKKPGGPAVPSIIKDVLDAMMKGQK